MNIQLTSKNAWVGAATQGIGAGIATELARCGANVTVMARNEEKLRDFTASLPIVTEGQHHEYLVADFSDFKTFKDVISRYFDDHDIDILVNNTNGPKAGPAYGQETEEYQAAFDLLFKTVCETTRLALPKMIERGGGRIINVSSSSVKEPIPNLALSNSIRTAVVAWSKTLSLEVAKHNVTINNILTGSFDTQRMKSLISSEAEKTGRAAEDIRKEKEGKIPMKRFGTPEEYGHLAAFLASDYAGYITGTSIPLDGGMSNTY